LLVIGMGCGLLTVSNPTSTPSEVITISPALPTILTRTPILTTEGMPTETFPSTALPPNRTLAPASTTQPAWTPGGVSFQGAVELQDGMCCIGGIVGTVVDLRTGFTAQSPFGPVVEMRRKSGMHCFSEAELADAAWEPFKTAVIEPFTITAINWVGHYLSAQYRDRLGNLSNVACDDISVEGIPAPPTPSVMSTPG